MKINIRKLAKVYKSNELNQANFTDFNLSSYRVFLNLLTKIKRYSEDNEIIPFTLLPRKYTLSAVEYANEFNVPQNLAYGILKTSIDKLFRTTFTLIDNNNIRKIAICAEAVYIKNEGKIDIEFTLNIMPHLSALTNQFTMYNLCEISGFNSIYTTRLYELIIQYKTTGRIEIEVGKLRYTLGCIETLNRYNDFKKYAFGHAVNEINFQFIINLNYEEVKNGRTVEKLIFTFKKTIQTKAYDPIRQKMRTQLVRPKRKADPNN